MGISQGEKCIAIRAGKDMRHARIVAHDFHIRCQTRNSDFFVVIGQGARGEIIDGNARENPQHKCCGGQPHQ